MFKVGKRNYTELPSRIDLILKYRITPKRCKIYSIKDKKEIDFYLQAINAIDLAIGWIEIPSSPEEIVDLFAYQVILAWLNRYKYK